MGQEGGAEKKKRRVVPFCSAYIFSSRICRPWLLELNYLFFFFCLPFFATYLPLLMMTFEGTRCRVI